MRLRARIASRSAPGGGGAAPRMDSRPRRLTPHDTPPRGLREGVETGRVTGRGSSRMSTALLLLLSLADPAATQEPDEAAPGLWQRDENVGLGLFPAVSMSPFQSLRTGLGPRLPSSIR